MRFSAVFLLVAVSAFAQDSRTWLNQGVQAFKNARYPEAVAAFQKAADLSPNDVTPRLYLATAYMQQFTPGAESPENLQVAQNAETEFQKVLDLDPQNRMALNSLASLSLNRKRWDDATNWYRRVLSADPNDRQAYYSLGFIAWSKWYPAYGAARARLGMRPEMPGPIADPATRTSLRAQWWSVLDEGMWNLNRALELDPQYDDAMAYLNLLVRERADLRDNAAEYQQDIAVADDWVRRALETKKLKAARGVGGAAVAWEVRTGAASTGDGMAMAVGIAAAPPPPPPPPGRSDVAEPMLQVAGNVQDSNIVSRVNPVYPQLAVNGRIQGTVRMRAVIGKDGHVKTLQMMTGHPLLAPAAIEAVKQWVYRPTLLNGAPVDVVTVIEIPFVLPN